MHKFMFSAVLSVLVPRALAVNGEGTYTVPVASALQASATYILEEVSWISAPDGTRLLHYALPEDLVGTQTIAIDMAGIATNSGEFFQLSGRQGTAMCARTILGVSCMIRLTDVSIDGQEVTQFLDRKYLNDGLSREQRKLVAGIFQREPIGIISITFDR